MGTREVVVDLEAREYGRVLLLEAPYHSAAFPEWLPGFFVKLLTDKDDTVMDPFVGSGTTTRVATKLDRAPIGIDIKREYVDRLRRRVHSLVHTRRHAVQQVWEFIRGRAAGMVRPVPSLRNPRHDADGGRRHWRGLVLRDESG